MRYRVSHSTIYEYRESVSVSQHLLRLAPRLLTGQASIKHEIEIEPEPRTRRTYTDYFGNFVEFITIESPHNRLVIRSVSTLNRIATRLPSPEETPSWERVRDLNRGTQQGAGLEACECLFDSPMVRVEDDFAEYAAPAFRRGTPILQAVLELTQRIHAEFTFDSNATTIATPVLNVLKNRRGVCQDFAHFQIGCLRALGLPARYVSGYIETFPPPGREKLVGSDASHAWIAFYCPGLGWIDVDPTNNLLPSTQHITLGWGRDFSDVSPVRGVILGSGEHTLRVAVDVERISENEENAARSRK